MVIQEASSDSEVTLPKYFKRCYSVSTTAESSAEKQKKRQKLCEEPLTSVAYITFPPKKYSEKKHRECAMEAIRQTVEARADVINITFANPADIDALKVNLETEMKGSAEQPTLFDYLVLKNDYRCNGPLMTLFSRRAGTLVREKEIDTGEGVPSICLTFNGPAGRITIINALVQRPWQHLLPSTKERILAGYVSAAQEQITSRILTIGGRLAELDFLKTYVQKKDLDFLLFNNADLSVLTKTSGPVAQHCSRLQSSAAAIVMIQLRDSTDSTVCQSQHSVARRRVWQRRHSVAEPSSPC